MNASALLQSQGWRGDGFSLDHSDRGLAKPLLVSRKSDLGGLGTKKNDFGNQWWTTAFDKSLKEFGSAQNANIAPVAAPPKQSALYSSFVKAETMESTIKDGEDKASKKRKAKDADEEQLAMPSFGVLGLPPTQASGEPQHAGIVDKRSSKKRKISEDDAESGKKRKLISEGGSTNEKLRWKNQKREMRPNITHDPEFVGPAAAASVGQTADFINLNEVNPGAPPAYDKKWKYNKGSNEALRLKKKAAKAARAEEDAKRKREARKYKPPPHPESITAMRKAGERLILPGDEGDENELRCKLIDAYESRNKTQGKALAKKLLKNALFSTTEADERMGSAQSDKKKRLAAKKSAKHWVVVRANPNIYRPDGTATPKLDPDLALGGEAGEAAAAAAAEKQARKEVRRQRRAEKQAAKKLKAGEKSNQAVAA